MPSEPSVGEGVGVEGVAARPSSTKGHRLLRPPRWEYHVAGDDIPSNGMWAATGEQVYAMPSLYISTQNKNRIT